MVLNIIPNQKTCPKEPPTVSLSYPPVSVSITLKDGDKIGGLNFIDGPGYTPASRFLYDPGRKAHFVADILKVNSDKVKSGPKQYVLD
jgi:hypothetical protein